MSTADASTACTDVIDATRDQPPFVPVSRVSFEPCTASRFVPTVRMRYQIAGIERTWDCVQAHDGVAVLLYHKQRRAFILVRQFRPAVLLARLKTQGVTDLNSVSDADVAFAFTTELCAGIVDKSKSLEEIACEEVMEECGYSISPSDLTLIGSHLNGVGTSGCLQTCFYAEADDSQKCNAGGGLQDHGEFIQVVSLPVQNAKEYIYNPNNASMAAGIRFIICWWFDTQASRYLQS